MARSTEPEEHEGRNLPFAEEEACADRVERSTPWRTRRLASGGGASHTGLGSS